MDQRKSVIHYGTHVGKGLTLLDAGCPVCCFDLETTGLNTATDRILSFSGLMFRMGKNGLLEKIEDVSTLMNPGFLIPPEASNINGITDEAVADAPTEEEGVKIMKDFFWKRPFVMTYNGTRFDIPFLENVFARHGEKFSPIYHLDVFLMAKEKLDLPSYRLSSVSHELGADMGLTFHQSMDDVMATVRSFKPLLQMYDESDFHPANPSMEILSCRYWERPETAGRLKRVYIQTRPDSKTYFDLYRKEWVTDLVADPDYVRDQVFRALGVSSEAEMVKKVKEK